MDEKLGSGLSDDEIEASLERVVNARRVHRAERADSNPHFTTIEIKPPVGRRCRSALASGDHQVEADSIDVSFI